MRTTDNMDVNWGSVDTANSIKAVTGADVDLM